MSKQSDQVYDILKIIFPYSHIEKEYYVKYKNTRLFFDFYIKQLALLFEIQGMQHFVFNRHMHGNDPANFNAQKKRDNLKLMYLEDNPKLTLVFFNYDDIITEELVLQRILEAQNKEPICP